MQEARGLTLQVMTMYISSKEADVRTVYAPQKNQTRKSRQTDCTVHEVGDRDGRYTLKSTQRECGRAAEQLNGAGRSEEQARDGKSDR